MLASLSSLFSVLPMIISTPALSAAACMPACTVCMKVSLWNTTPAISGFSPAGAGAALSAGTSKTALPSVSMNCLISASMPRPK